MNTKELTKKVKSAIKEKNKQKIKAIVIEIAEEILNEIDTNINTQSKVFANIIMEISQELSSIEDENFFLLEAIGINKTELIEKGKDLMTIDLIKKGAEIGKDISFSPEHILLSPKAHQLLLESLEKEDQQEFKQYITTLKTEEADIMLEKQLNIPLFANLFERIYLRKKELNIDAFAYYLTALVTGFNLKHPEIKLLDKILDFFYSKDFVGFQQILKIIQDESRINLAWKIYGDYKYEYYTYPLEDLVIAGGGEVKKVFNSDENKTVKTWGLKELEIISKLWGDGIDACNLNLIMEKMKTSTNS